MGDLHKRTLSDIADAIVRGELSSSEVTESLLARIHARDPEFRCYALVLDERARSAAAQCDRRQAAGEPLGLLHGVPVAIKDLLFTKGVVTTSGSKAFDDFVPDVDATVVTRLEAAGAVLVGKTKLTEGAFSVHHPEIEHPVNPWNSAYWTGVSSSGSGVAVAAGLAYGATGSDTGGSIRFPSALCGLVGIKPTYGRVSRFGAFPLAESLDHMGPMTRSVADAARMLQAMAGFDPKDPTSLHEDVPDYARSLDTGLRGLSIGVDPAFVETGVDPGTVAAIHAALEILEGLGATIREVTVPDATELVHGWGLTCAVECAHAHAPYFEERRAKYGPVLAGLIEAGQVAPAQAYVDLERARERFRADLDAVLREVDTLVAPCMHVPPVTWDLLDAVLENPDAVDGFVAFTAPFDYSGHPTITLPTGRLTAENMPLGFQLVGRHLGEPDLIRAGSAFESEVGFHHPID